MAASARAAALAVLRRVRTTDAYANLVLPSEITRAGLDARDAALATELAYGTLRMLGTLDWAVSIHSKRPLDRIDGDALDALRLGAYQLLFTKVPAHAAVAETVGCMRPSAKGFGNAVLRRIASDGVPWPSPDGDFATYLAIRYGHPGWIVRLWISELGPRDAEALCGANNVFGGIGVRVNTSRITPDELRGRFASAGLDVRPGRYAPDALVVEGGGAPTAWPGFAEGLFSVQDESSVLAGAAVQGGGVAVDLCAGPGGKTAHVAEAGGRVVACDVRRGRAKLVAENVRRLGGRVAVVQADGRTPPVAGGVDAVLVDAPCSGLGVLRRRPEARWRVRASDVEGSMVLQAELLRAGFALLRRGGELVYAVCTVTLAETVGVMGGFLESDPEAEVLPVLTGVPRVQGRNEPALQLLPHVHGTDGMFVAKVRRRR